jgi:hypothetical protein
MPLSHHYNLPLSEGGKTMHVIGRLQEFALRCPGDCGGKVSEGVRFFLTQEQDVVIHGYCHDCGASGLLVLPLSALLLHAPEALIN